MTSRYHICYRQKKDIHSRKNGPTYKSCHCCVAMLLLSLRSPTVRSVVVKVGMVRRLVGYLFRANDNLIKLDLTARRLEVGCPTVQEAFTAGGSRKVWCQQLLRMIHNVPNHWSNGGYWDSVWNYSAATWNRLTMMLMESCTGLVVRVGERRVLKNSGINNVNKKSNIINNPITMHYTIWSGFFGVGEVFRESRILAFWSDWCSHQKWNVYQTFCLKYLFFCIYHGKYLCHWQTRQTFSITALHVYEHVYFLSSNLFHQVTVNIAICKYFMHA